LITKAVLVIYLISARCHQACLDQSYNAGGVYIEKTNKCRCYDDHEKNDLLGSKTIMPIPIGKEKEPETNYKFTKELWE
jgi:hypothetical protein